ARRRAHAARRAAIVSPALALAAASLALAAGLAGCGSSAPSGTSADPAGLAPASTAVYVGAVVRPTGSLRTDALAAGHALTHQANPYTRLLGVLQTPGSPTLDYSHDVAPWLGPDAGLFYTSLGSSGALESLLAQGLTGGGGSGAEWPFGAGGAQGAIVLDTSDLAAAKTFVSNAAAHAGAHASTYKGVAYQASAGGDAFAVVDRFVVLGTESGVHAAIEAAQGATPALKTDATYARLLGVAPANALAHVYANPAALSPAHGGATGAQQLPSQLLSVLGGMRPLNVSLVPAQGSLTLDADVGPPPAGATGTAAQSGGLVAAVAAGNRALAALPGESWLAAGLGDVGGALGGGLEGLHGLLSLATALGGAAAGEGVTPTSAQATLSVKGLVEALLVPVDALSSPNAQSRHALLGWMGEAGVFASGASVLELRAGVVIDSKDPTASRAAVDTLASALRHAGEEASPVSLPGTEAAVEAKITGLPVTLVIADGRGSDGQTKFVMGLGAPSVQDALNPSSTMSGASSYSAAQSALGEGIQ
ncbi:MAG TPA: DUF3352 domain-containing protein, partial [Solirubrobacteraceae bacterium]|nr:DUF3352 domain-containing protein [Solirubrobacteraceae bacterium]